MSDSKIYMPALSSIKITLPQFCLDTAWIVAESRKLWTEEACEKRATEREDAFYRTLGH
jgi:hypothetical protein